MQPWNLLHDAHTVFDVVCVMRERTPLPRAVIERLPRLKLIASTGSRNAAIDIDAAAERGIVVTHTGYSGRSTVEMTWALILASARQVASENAYLRAGGWQHTLGDGLQGKTLGVLGLLLLRLPRPELDDDMRRHGPSFAIEMLVSDYLRYCSSVTCSIQSTTLPSFLS